MKSRICCRKIVNRILKACTHAAVTGSATLTAKLQSLGLLQIKFLILQYVCFIFAIVKISEHMLHKEACIPWLVQEKTFRFACPLICMK